MGTGFVRLLRWLAVAGMGMAFLDFSLRVSNWAAPPHQPWVGKRFKDTVSPQSVGGVPARAATSGDITQYSRGELGSLYAGLREPSMWFCLAGILYLFARHQEAVHGRLTDDDEE